MIISFLIDRMAAVRKNSVIFLLQSLFPGDIWVREAGVDEKRKPLAGLSDFDFRYMRLPIRFYATEKGDTHPSVTVMGHRLSIGSMMRNSVDSFEIELVQTVPGDGGVPSSRVTKLMPREAWGVIASIPDVKLHVLYRRGLLAEKLDGIGTVFGDLFPWSSPLKRLSPYVKMVMPS